MSPQIWILSRISFTSSQEKGSGTKTLSTKNKIKQFKKKKQEKFCFEPGKSPVSLATTFQASADTDIPELLCSFHHWSFTSE